MQDNLSRAWKPHRTHLVDRVNAVKLSRGVDTLAEAQSYVKAYVEWQVDFYLTYQINDSLFLSIYSGLRHTTNRDTWGLARDRIPQDNTLDETLRFLMAFIHERAIGEPVLIETIKGELYLGSGNKYQVRYPSSLVPTITTWTARADKIVELMQTAQTKIGGFAAYADFMRDWAMIELGEVTGLELTTAGNSVQIGYDRVTTDVTTLEKSELQPTSSVKIVRLKGIWQTDAMRAANTTDTVTVTAKNGPNQFRIKTSGTWGRWVTLLPNSTHTFPKAQLTGSDVNIESRPILVPTATRELADVTLAVAVTESVDLTGLFEGLNISITAVSADTDKATVQVNQAQTSMGVVGVAAGTVKITVTGSNLAGSTEVEFTVTVTEAASD